MDLSPLNPLSIERFLHMAAQKSGAGGGERKRQLDVTHGIILIHGAASVCSHHDGEPARWRSSSSGIRIIFDHLSGPWEGVGLDVSLLTHRNCHSFMGASGGLYIQDNEKCTSEKVLVDIDEPPDEPRFDVDFLAECDIMHA